ncbi:hypothetical protein BGW80DRAFT_1302245 [Lactifluus volemus]|nr:hypothetical protein BGW80DRAFT_1302245 [Lactifluus volemus]
MTVTDASSIAGAAHTTTTTAATTVVGVQGQQGQEQEGTSTTPPEALEGLLQQILASNSAPALAGTLRITVVTPEEREVILASVTTTGTDPLDALDTTQHTIGILFILSARLTIASTNATAPAVPFAYINNFCRNFIPEEARLAPERVTMLAKGIVQRAEALGSGKAAITPLYDLLTRFAPDISHLTPIHPIFVTSCATTHFFNAALSVLEVPISQISTTLCPDLRYQDHLVYHYTGGIVLAALKRYAEAAEFFELCASAPVAGPPVTNGGSRGPSQGPIGMSLGGMGMGMGGMGMGMGMGMGGMGYGGMGMGGMGMGGMGYGSMGYGGMGYGGLGYGMIPPGPGGKYGNIGSSDPSVFQIEAAKKLLLVQLILHGKTLPLPKYTHPAVSLKGNAYTTLAQVYPNIEQVHVVATKEQAAFAVDDNIGLLRLVVERAPRWAIRKLTETYLTLSLAEIGRAAGIEDVEEVRRIVLSMIETGEIEASIDAHGSVTFADEEPPVASKAEIDRALRVAQEQEQVLRKLEREIARNKEYLQKAVRSREETSSSSQNWPYFEEELLAGSRWPDESVF